MNAGGGLLLPLTQRPAGPSSCGLLAISALHLCRIHAEPIRLGRRNLPLAAVDIIRGKSRNPRCVLDDLGDGEAEPPLNENAVRRTKLNCFHAGISQDSAHLVAAAEMWEILRVTTLMVNG